MATQNLLSASKKEYHKAAQVEEEAKIGSILS